MAQYVNYVTIKLLGKERERDGGNGCEALAGFSSVVNVRK